ncbi:MAG: hypothetical protein R3B09_33615 [Nannocystaceae bacterium]
MRLRPLARLLASFTLALTLVAGCGYKNALKQGDEAMATQRYEDALGFYRRALELKPDSAEAQQKVAAAQEKATAARIDAGKAKLAARDFAGAIDDAAGAVAIHPSPAVRAFVDEVTAAVSGEGERLAEAGVYAEGLALVDGAIAKIPSASDKLAGPRRDLAERWSAALDAGATAAEGAGRLGDALLQRAMIVELVGDDAQRSARDRLLGQLKARSSFRVAQSPTRDAAAGALAQRLVGADPSRWIEVLAPGPAQGETAATLTFTLQKARFTTDKRDRSESARYQSGTKQVPNTFYKMAQDKVSDQERRVLEAEKEVTKQEQYVAQYRKDVEKEGPSPNTSTGAEQNLYNAENRLESAQRNVQSERDQLQQRRDELQRTPQTKDEPVYTDVQYKITTHTLTATAKLVGGLTPAGGTKVDLGRELTTDAKDDAHDGVSAAGIAADPLQLPSHAELEGRLADAAIAEVAGRIGEAFAAYRRSILDRASGDDDKVDRMVLFLLLDPRPAIRRWTRRSGRPAGSRRRAPGCEGPRGSSRALARRSRRSDLASPRPRRPSTISRLPALIHAGLTSRCTSRSRRRCSRRSTGRRWCSRRR